MENIEVEIKLEVSLQKYTELCDKLRLECEIIHESTQKDIYYSPKHCDFFVDMDKCLRIRQADSWATLDYKQIHFGKNDEETFMDEVSVVIGSITKMEKLLAYLDIERILCVEKKRIEYRYKDCCKIALDKVKNLGYFIEIECDKKDLSVEESNRLVYGVVEELELNTANKNNEGYSNLLYKKINQ
ncbi:MAG: class IV adenylate cyclase [Bacillota bacterium]